MSGLDFYNVSNKTTPAWRLFHELWPIRVKRIHLLSKDQINNHGVYVNNASHVSGYLDEIANPSLTIIAITKLHIEDGADVELHRPEDCIEMLRLIREHLDNCVKLLNTPLAMFRPKLEDLRVLDQMGEVLHRVASHYASPGEIGGGLMGFAHRFSFGNVRKGSSDPLAPSPASFVPYKSPLLGLAKQNQFAAASSKSWA